MISRTRHSLSPFMAPLMVILVLHCGCSTTAPDRERKARGEGTSKTDSLSESVSPGQLPTDQDVISKATAVPPASWIEKRVSNSRDRLQATSAGQLVMSSIDAHGGLGAWFTRGPLAFRFRYEPLSGEKVRDTFQVVDTWSARARHTLVADPSQEFGWTGELAWVVSENAENFPLNPRFWALTPFYFVAIPFVLADPGVQLLEEGTAELEGRLYDLVRVTYDSGTGDAPDDFYVVYFDQNTHRVGAVRYIVSYPGFFPDGGHSPEKLMIYDGKQHVEGIVFPESFRTFKWAKGQVGEQVTRAQMSQVEFQPEVDPSFFDAPDQASVRTGY